ncbi:MAG: Rieske (2Fe-2S) protein [Bradymonadaceae bacterium]
MREIEGADKFYKVLAADALANGEAKMVFAGVKRLALFRVDDEFHCIQSHCPHAGAPLANGTIEGCKVHCPRHSWVFDVQTGACETDPRYDVRRYEVRVEDGFVFVGLPETSHIV